MKKILGLILMTALSLSITLPALAAADGITNITSSSSKQASHTIKPAPFQPVIGKQSGGFWSKLNPVKWMKGDENKQNIAKFTNEFEKKQKEGNLPPLVEPVRAQPPNPAPIAPTALQPTPKESAVTPIPPAIQAEPGVAPTPIPQQVSPTVKQ